MSAVSTLLYIAPPNDAETIATAEDAEARWPSIWLRHVGDRELVALWSVISGHPPEQGTTLMAKLLFQGSESGPFVMRVPDEFVSTVAAVQVSAYHRIAEEWQHAAGLPDWRWRPEVITSVLGDLCDFARRAVAERSAVLQVMSL